MNLQLHFSNRFGLFLKFGMILLVLGINNLVWAQPISHSPTGGFFSLNGTLASGQSINPTYPLFNNSRDFNFSLTIGGSGPVALTLFNGSGQTIWSGTIQAGETLWGSGTLTLGNNDILLTNNGPAQATFALTLYDLPMAAYTWAGTAVDTGLNSQARLIFPSSGLYTFTFGVSSGRYQFFLNTSYIQKTVETTTSVTYFVPAGTHTLTVVQDSVAGANWSVGISGVGAANDSLPYEKTGGNLGGAGNDFVGEWLPINLAGATLVNLDITLTGTPGDSLLVELTDGQGAILTLPDVFAGETLWATADLPAGTTLIRLVADAINTGPLSYDLTLAAIPGPTYTWTGNSTAGGLNSTIRLNFPSNGRYTFAFTANNGRYQFLLDNQYIEKTVPASTSVTYFVPAGTHNLTIIQDTGPGANWSVQMSLQGAGNDTLPYSRSGSEVGGAGNDFSEEWLPVSLDTATTVNLNLELTGNITDSLSLEVYNSGSNTPDFTLNNALGSEDLWANFPLSAGVNRLHLVASGGNAAPLDYSLTLSAIPPASSAVSWAGSSLAAGENSQFMVNIPTAGLYRFDLDNSEGFANLVLDDALGRAPEANGSHYDIMVTAGSHVVHTIQDANYPVTDWSATLTPVTGGENFFTFTGTINPGDTVIPEYPLFDASLDFNFSLENSGGDVDLTIRNGSDAQVWAGTALNGETLWGTGTLTQGTNRMILVNNSATPVNVTLMLYTLPTAGYDWIGVADGSGLNSQIQVNFPTDGLYTFNFATNSGRYQFLVDTSFIQKTVEGATAVTYFVPAGTHNLFLVQDSAAGADWSVSISDVGDSNDTLPYTKNGGQIGGVGNDFTEEWLPLYLDAATQVNLALTITGTPGDTALLEVGSFSAMVYVGETYWASLDLPAGQTDFHLSATATNALPVTYQLIVYDLPDLPYTWQGNANPAGLNSHIQVDFPVSGLYQFDLGVTNGRYQFLLDDNYIQKTAENNSSVVYFVLVGLHDLTLDQDTGSGADWQVSISQVGDSYDSLPYQHSGGELGGSGNDFTEEWLPINLNSNTEVNLLLSLTGDITDSIRLEVREMLSDTVIQVLDPVYGTESVWTTLNIPVEGARLYLVAGGNNNSLSYDVAIDDLPRITGLTQDSHTWSGVSLNNGLNSTIRINTELSGTYHFEVLLPEGFATLFIDSSPPLRAPDGGGIFYEFDAPLTAGLHTFITDQDDTPSFPVTSWVVTATLMTADAPTITSVNPAVASNNVPTALTLNGTNFMAEATVVLIEGTTVYTLTDVSYVSGSVLTAVVPAGLPVGNYDVVVTNPDTQSATLPDGFELFLPEFFIYLPVVAR